MAYDYGKQLVSYGAARESREEDELRKQLAIQALGSGYEAWGASQHLRTKEALGKTFDIGDKKGVPMYERTGGWLSDMFQPWHKRIRPTSQYKEALTTKAYGTGFEGGGFEPTIDQARQELSAAYKKDIPDYKALEDPLTKGEGLLSQVGQGVKDVFSNLPKGGPMNIYSGGTPISKGGYIPRSTNRIYSPGVGGGMTTSASTFKGIPKSVASGVGKAGETAKGAAGILSKTGTGATTAAANLAAETSKSALASVGGALDVAGGAGSIYNLATTDFSTGLDLTKTSGAKKAASTGADIANLVTLGTGGASAPITEPLAWLLRAGSI